MPTHWHQRIRQSEALARRMEQQIPQILADPEITADHANQLFAAVNQHVLEVERFMDELEKADVTDDILDAAERTEQRWNLLAHTRRDRLVALRTQ